MIMDSGEIGALKMFVININILSVNILIKPRNYSFE